MLLCVVEQSAGEQDGLLPLGEAAHDGVGLARRRVRERQAARRHSGADIVDAQPRAGLQRVVIVRVFKRQRQDAGVDEVGRMDAREALGHDAADAEIHRHERRVLARRALPVVAAADDDAVPGRSGARRKGRVADREAKLRQLRDVRAIRQDLRPRRHDVVGRDVVAHLEHELRRERVGKGPALREGLALCSGPLLLSLFPFLVVSRLLVQCPESDLLALPFRLAAWGIGIRTPCAARVLCIGFLGGFAPAASAAAQAVRTGQLTAEEADALLPACICSGPSFVVLTVGQSLLGSAELGVLLFASQITANYLTAALLNRFAGVRSVKPGSAAQASPAPPRLDEILADAAITYCKLCGFILFFRMLAAGAGALLPAGAGTLCSILLEVCSGCDLASRTGRWGSLLCCAALSVQGLSVLLQVRTICPPEMTLRPLYRARMLHLPLSLALFYLLLPGGEADVFSTLPARVLLMRRVPPDCALLVFAVCCMAACTLRSGIRQVEQKQMARNAGGCCINSKTLL